jgi:sulfate adenylyltransferase subunit 1 (EFTu-like GTPase family)
MDYYEGPTVLDLLDQFPAGAEKGQTVWMPIQDVYKFTPRRRAANRGWHCGPAQCQLE